ncbi:MAG: response regulator transcription factor [Bacteroidota bacterium]
MRIMIVDDSQTFREAISHILSKNTAHQIVGEAENGKHAVEMFEKINPDLILMDIEMPVMNGINASKLILKKNKAVKIIAVSNYDEKLYLKEIIDAGLIGFVNKNKVFDQLEDAITHAYIGKLYIPNELK